MLKQTSEICFRSFKGILTVERTIIPAVYTNYPPLAFLGAIIVIGFMQTQAMPRRRGGLGR